MGTIYLLTLGSKLYVGQTVDLERRLKQHFRKTVIQRYRRSIRLYAALGSLQSVDGVSVDILEDEIETCSALNMAELFWISNLRSCGCELLNMRDGGDVSSGRIFSVEYREKLSRSKQGERNPAKREDVRAKISKAHRGKVLTVEHRKKIAESCKRAAQERYNKKNSR